MSRDCKHIARAFENSGSSFVGSRPFRVVLPDLGGLNDMLDALHRAASLKAAGRRRIRRAPMSGRATPSRTPLTWLWRTTAGPATGQIGSSRANPQQGLETGLVRHRAPRRRSTRRRLLGFSGQIAPVSTTKTGSQRLRALAPVSQVLVVMGNRLSLRLSAEQQVGSGGGTASFVLSPSPPVFSAPAQ